MSTLALIGGAEFQSGNESVDRYLIARAWEIKNVKDPRSLGSPKSGIPEAQQRGRSGGDEAKGARGVIIPTAAAKENPFRAARNGTLWFQALGIPMDDVMIVDQVTADYRHFVALVEQANFFYLLGGEPRYLLDTLRGSKAWKVIEEKYRAGQAVVAGASAGAMVLATMLTDFNGNYVPALNLTPVPIVVAPHFHPGSPTGSLALPGAYLFGIAERTGAVFEGDEWLVLGPGQVHVVAPNGETRAFKNGERFRIG